MLKAEFTSQFKKDYKLALKRGCDPKELEAVIALLMNEQPLPEKSYKGSFNVRISPELHKNLALSATQRQISEQSC